MVFIRRKTGELASSLLASTTTKHVSSKTGELASSLLVSTTTISLVRTNSPSSFTTNKCLTVKMQAF